MIHTVILVCSFTLQNAANHLTPSAKLPPPRVEQSLRMDAFPASTADYEDEAADVKAALRVAYDAGDAKKIQQLVVTLESLNPTERCATSPLLEGYWETIFASSPAHWMRDGRVRHVIEAWTEGKLGPGSAGILAGPRGNRWDDVADGRGAYVQRARLRFGSREVRGTYTWLGGEAWDIQYVSSARLLFGVPIWKRQLSGPTSADLDHAVRPTFVDGEICVLRAPAVRAGDCELRADRIYVLRRLKNRLWQDGTFEGLSDKPVLGFELDP